MKIQLLKSPAFEIKANQFVDVPGKAGLLPSTDSTDECLTSKLINGKLIEIYGTTNFNNGFKAKMSLVNWPKSSRSPTVEIELLGENCVLNKIKNASGTANPRFYGSVSLVRFSKGDNGTLLADNVKTLNLKETLINSQDGESYLCKAECKVGPADIRRMSTKENYYAIFTITIHFDCVPEQARVTSKMIIDEGIGFDSVIVASCGESIKCHKRILSAFSTDFEVLFESSTTNQIIMSDFSGAAVRGFLNFMYYGETPAQCGAFMEVFEIARKYNAAKLIDHMTQILLMKQSEWFDEMSASLNFFKCVIGLGKRNELRIKALNIIRGKNKSELKKSEHVKRFIVENQDETIELLAALADIDSEPE